MVKYFINPFGVGGDLSPIPDSAQPSGSISYAQGFPINYEYPQTQPGSLDIPRDSTNQLFFDITSNVQQYQQNGTPFFITTSDNNGSPYSYSIYATVLYDDGVNGIRKYMSKKNSNTDLPSVISSWWIIDNTSNSVVYENSIFDPSVSSGQVVYFDSTSSTFKLAIANGAEQQIAIGIADIEDGRVYSFGSYPFFTGLSPGLTYYLSTTVAGSITTVLPISNVVEIGFSKSATEIFLNIRNLAYQDLSQNGYTYLPGGLILQFFTVLIHVTLGGNFSTQAATFPTPFQNPPFYICGNLNQSTGTTRGENINCYSQTSTGFQIDFSCTPANPFGATTDIPIQFIAIGV
jgi:hypothetical protein